MKTRDLPCQPIVDGSPTLVAFTGVDIGEFFVHHTLPDKHLPLRGWYSVTHTRTGFAIQTNIPTKARAVRLARKLRHLGCWDFDRPEQAQDIKPELLALIRMLRAEA